MNTKTLKSINGELLQITLSQWETVVLKSAIKMVSITKVTDDINNRIYGVYSTDSQSVGKVLLSMASTLNKRKEK